jgi:hypothetical protein
MIVSFVIALAFFVAARTGHEVDATTSLLVTIAATTVAWVVVTFCTRPVGDAALVTFYEKVRPAGPGWAAVRRRFNLPPSSDSLPSALLGWVLGIAAVYGALFATGAFVYGKLVPGFACAVVAAAAAAGLFVIGRRLWHPMAGPAPHEG